MQLQETPLKGCYILQPRVFKDNRGTFYESFNSQKFEDLSGLKTHFVQDNESKSSKGVLRGLHFQTGEFAQAKLVRVVKGKVQDVVVDLRENSKTYGQAFSVLLSAENKTQLYVPKSFAHGFLTLEKDTIFSYKCDSYYNISSESGIIYNDPDIAIKWRKLDIEYILSNKDLGLPTLKELAL